jgi:hypothetical protein
MLAYPALHYEIFTGVAPTNLVAFKGEVLFSGVDAAGVHGFWVTEGTTAGTYENSVNGAQSPFGLNPYDLTVFNNEVLFGGLDARANKGCCLQRNQSRASVSAARGGRESR